MCNDFLFNLSRAQKKIAELYYYFLIYYLLFLKFAMLHHENLPASHFNHTNETLREKLPNDKPSK